MRKLLLIIFSIIIFCTINIPAQIKSLDTRTKVQIQTDSGTIILVLYEETSLHKGNFLKLVTDNYYNGQFFHRLIKGFMIQGGDPNSKDSSKFVLLGEGDPGYTIPAEILPKYFHKKGVLAAAREGNNVNPSKASSGSQFYIVQGNVFTQSELDELVSQHRHLTFTEEERTAYMTVGGSPHLDGQYTIFGEITNGFDVLDKLMTVPTDQRDRPLTNLIYTINILK